MTFQPKTSIIPIVEKAENIELNFEFDERQKETILRMREDGLTSAEIANALKFEEKIPLHIKIAVVNELFASKKD